MRCIEKPGIILFTKDATCFARMPYDYKILFYLGTTNAINIYVNRLFFDFLTAIWVYFSIFCFAVDEIGDV